MRITYILLLFVFVFSACKKSDDVTPETPVQNEISFKDRKISLQGGVIIDFGYSDQYTNWSFAIADSPVKLNATKDDTEETPVSFVIGFDLYVQGNTFKPGTYTLFSDLDKVTTTTNFLGSGAIIYTQDQKKSIDEDDFKEIRLTSGTVEVKAKGSSYELVFNVQLQDGTTLQGTYDGEFVKLDA